MFVILLFIQLLFQPDFGVNNHNQSLWSSHSTVLFVVISGLAFVIIVLLASYIISRLLLKHIRRQRIRYRHNCERRIHDLMPSTNHVDNRSALHSMTTTNSTSGLNVRLELFVDNMIMLSSMPPPYSSTIIDTAPPPPAYRYTLSIHLFNTYLHSALSLVIIVLHHIIRISDSRLLLSIAHRLNQTH